MIEPFALFVAALLLLLGFVGLLVAFRGLPAVQAFVGGGLLLVLQVAQARLPQLLAKPDAPPS